MDGRYQSEEGRRNVFVSSSLRSRLGFRRCGFGLYHDEKARDVAAKRVQADEILSFCYAHLSQAGISQASYFNWKMKYDGLLPDEMRRLKQLEDENAKLKSSAVSQYRVGQSR